MVAPTLNAFGSSFTFQNPSLLHSLPITTLTSINCRTASESPTPKNRSFNNNNTRKNKGITSDSNPFPPPPLQMPLPKPPAGFVVDQHRKVLTASRDRLATLVDPANNLSLECVVRRQFRSSQGDDCMLLCPVDMPIQMLKNMSDGWLDVNCHSLFQFCFYILDLGVNCLDLMNKNFKNGISI